MVKRCFILNCKTGRKSDRHSVVKYSLFKAPNDEYLLQQWRNNVPLRERELTSQDRVCEKHFEERYVIPRWQQSRYGDYYEDHIRPKLAPDAVPTVFTDTDSRLIRLKAFKVCNDANIPNRTVGLDFPDEANVPNKTIVLELPEVEVNENDSVPVCYKCLIRKCSLHISLQE